MKGNTLWHYAVSIYSALIELISGDILRPFMWAIKKTNSWAISPGHAHSPQGVWACWEIILTFISISLSNSKPALIWKCTAVFYRFWQLTTAPILPPRERSPLTQPLRYSSSSNNQMTDTAAIYFPSAIPHLVSVFIIRQWICWTTKGRLRFTEHNGRRVFWTNTLSKLAKKQTDGWPWSRMGAIQ